MPSSLLLLGSQIVSAQPDRLRQSESYIGAVLDQVEAKSYEFILNARFMELGTIGMDTIGRSETAPAESQGHDRFQPGRGCQ